MGRHDRNQDIEHTDHHKVVQALGTVLVEDRVPYCDLHAVDMVYNQSMDRRAGGEGIGVLQSLSGMDRLQEAQVCSRAVVDLMQYQNYHT